VVKRTHNFYLAKRVHTQIHRTINYSSVRTVADELRDTKSYATVAALTLNDYLCDFNASVFLTSAGLFRAFVHHHCSDE
jgi:hypothetical protein